MPSIQTTNPAEARRAKRAQFMNRATYLEFGDVRLYALVASVHPDGGETSWTVQYVERPAPIPAALPTVRRSA